MPQNSNQRRSNRRKLMVKLRAVELFNILIEYEFFWIELSKYFTLNDWKHLTLVSKKVNKYWTNVRDTKLLGNQKVFNKALQHNKLHIIKTIFNNPIFMKNIDLNIVSIDKLYIILIKNKIENNESNYFSTLLRYCSKYSCVIYAAMNGHIALFEFLFDKLCNKNNNDYYIFGILLRSLNENREFCIIDIILNSQFLLKYIDWAIPHILNSNEDIYEEIIKIKYTNLYPSPFNSKLTCCTQHRFKMDYIIPIAKLYKQMQNKDFFDYNSFTIKK